MEVLYEFLEYIVIAFIASAALIFAAKIVLNAIIRRSTQYYEAKEILDEELMYRDAGMSGATDASPDGESCADDAEGHDGEVDVIDAEGHDAKAHADSHGESGKEAHNA